MTTTTSAMTEQEHYISQVVDCLPQASRLRASIAMELRDNLQARVESGQPVDEVLRQLGDPVALAESYLAAVPLVSAPFWSRAAAKIIDVIAIAFVVGPIAGLVALLVRAEWVPLLIVMIIFLGGSVLFGAYTTLSEWAFGQTLGKLALDLRVVRESGARISLAQSAVRQLPMLLNIY
ncbi:MAG: hypothetical protein GEV06_10235 [Luteitalea sp.]|nr:hypothetical protein [Luteitalea sp.]